MFQKTREFKSHFLVNEFTINNNKSVPSKFVYIIKHNSIYVI